MSGINIILIIVNSIFAITNILVFFIEKDKKQILWAILFLSMIAMIVYGGNNG